MSVLIIAEAGVNHNGCVDRAKRLIDAAAEAGADVVKFQTSNPGASVRRSAAKAAYQRRATGGDESQFEMLSRLVLDEVDHRQLLRHAESKGVSFLSTPFFLGGVDFLVRDLGLRRLKVSSGEIVNAPLLWRAAALGVDVILSTGMCTLEEIREALGVLAHGYTSGDSRPNGRSSFLEAFQSDEGKAALQEHVCLLHCTTEYPAAFEDVNLRAMDTLREEFGLPVGLSDHSVGTSVPLAAVAREAQVIEKHFTLDRGLPGPDHQASVEPGELRQMVRGIREVERALGTREKVPVEAEVRNRAIVRKSLVASRVIRMGEALSSENVAVKRPADGVSPMDYWDWLGRVVTRDVAEDESLGEECVR